MLKNEEFICALASSSGGRDIVDCIWFGLCSGGGVFWACCLVNSVGGRDGSAIMVGLMFLRPIGGGFCCGIVFGCVGARMF